MARRRLLVACRDQLIIFFFLSNVLRFSDTEEMHVYRTKFGIDGNSVTKGHVFSDEMSFEYVYARVDGQRMPV